MSKDPRKTTQPLEDNDYADLWAQVIIPAKDDAELIDASGTAETTEAQTQTEEWPIRGVSPSLIDYTVAITPR
jgi:hypothetical protein